MSHIYIYINVNIKCIVDVVFIIISLKSSWENYSAVYYVYWVSRYMLENC